MAASGYAAVWATDNTREAIFDAMKRKETYGTTGTRMAVRFFGGFDFEPGDAQTRSRRSQATVRACRWAGISPLRPRAKLRLFLSQLSKIRSEPTSIATDRQRLDG